MKKIKKTLALLCCAVLLVVISVGATIAYLTDTDDVTNTFVVGHIDITLDEAPVYEYGDENIPEDKEHGQELEDYEDRVKENEYKLYPGHTYDKDPMITIYKKSEDCYVAAKIVVTGAEDSPLVYTEGEGENAVKLLGIEKVVTGGVFAKSIEFKGLVNGVYRWESEEAILTQQKVGDTFVFMVYYKAIVKNNETADQYRTLFTNITIPGDYDNDELLTLGDLVIDITAYAMQADGFDGVEDAYELCDGSWTEYEHEEDEEEETTTPDTGA